MEELLRLVRNSYSIFALIGVSVAVFAAVRLYRRIRKRRRDGVPATVEREAAVREELPVTGTQALRAIGDGMHREFDEFKKVVAHDMHREFNDLKKVVVLRAHERLINGWDAYDSEVLALTEALAVAVDAALQRYREARERARSDLNLDALIAPSPAASTPLPSESLPPEALPEAPVESSSAEATPENTPPAGEG